MSTIRNTSYEIIPVTERRLLQLSNYWIDISEMIAKEQAETDYAKKIELGLELDRMTKNYAKANILTGEMINIPIYITK